MKANGQTEDPKYNKILTIIRQQQELRKRLQQPLVQPAGTALAAAPASTSVPVSTSTGSSIDL
jgi:hypothetical protein